MKTISLINKKIKQGRAVVVTADEMTEIVKSLGPERAAHEVDVVTTGTFGAMCSSGIWVNFGHSEPPIKMSKVWLNGVEGYAGVAAVDAFFGATQPSREKGYHYGGAHLIEDLIQRKNVKLRAISSGTDCYPRQKIETYLAIDDLNQAVMCNPRNAYQRYPAATNSSSRTLFTYMGKLLPHLGNINYSGAGCLSPLINDPDFETIGVGTRIFLGGTEGYVVGPGTQHNPTQLFGTLMVIGNLKKMDPNFLKAAVFKRYGCTLFVGVGIPIPILNARLAAKTAISDEQIKVPLLDYSVPSSTRPVLAEVTYAQLKSGEIEIQNRKVKTSSLSSWSKAKEVALTLKTWIEKGKFFLSEPVERLPLDVSFRSLPKKRKGLVISSPEKALVNQHQGEIWLKERCIHCGACVSLCPENAFYREADGRINFERALCQKCGLCRDGCPREAILI